MKVRTRTMATVNACSTSEQGNKWELLSMQDADYLKNEGISCKLFTYRVK